MNDRPKCECIEGNHGHTAGECAEEVLPGKKVCSTCNKKIADVASKAIQLLSEPLKLTGLSEAVKSTTRNH